MVCQLKGRLELGTPGLECYVVSNHVDSDDLRTYCWVAVGDFDGVCASGPRYRSLQHHHSAENGTTIIWRPTGTGKAQTLVGMYSQPWACCHAAGAVEEMIDPVVESLYDGRGGMGCISCAIAKSLVIYGSTSRQAKRKAALQPIAATAVKLFRRENRTQRRRQTLLSFDLLAACPHPLTWPSV